MQHLFFNNYNSYELNSNLFLLPYKNKNFFKNINIIKSLNFNYLELLRNGEYKYFKSFFLKFYFYYSLIENIGGQKPIIRKVKFISVPELKKKKFYNFKILILSTIKKKKSFLILLNYLFTFSKFSKALSTIFKKNSYFLIWSNKNFLNIKLINSHFFNSFLENNFYYLENSSFIIKLSFPESTNILMQNFFKKSLVNFFN